MSINLKKLSRSIVVAAAVSGGLMASPNAEAVTTLHAQQSVQKDALSFDSEDGLRSFDAVDGVGLKSHLQDGDYVSIEGSTVNVHNKNGALVASIDAKLPENMELYLDKDGTIVPVLADGIADRACTNNKWVKWGVGAAFEGLVCIPASAGTGGAASVPCTIAAGAAATAVGC